LTFPAAPARPGAPAAGLGGNSAAVQTGQNQGRALGCARENLHIMAALQQLCRDSGFRATACRGNSQASRFPWSIEKVARLGGLIQVAIGSAGACGQLPRHRPVARSSSQQNRRSRRLARAAKGV